MIRSRPQYEKAHCDACGADLLLDSCMSVKDGTKYPHYGLLQACFGYDSNLDDLAYQFKKKHLCAPCWEKALRAVGLWTKTYEDPMPTDGVDAVGVDLDSSTQGV